MIDRRRLRRWWARRTLRSRITVVVGVVALVAVLALSRLAVGLLGSALSGAADVELREQARTAADQIEAGTPADAVAPSIRVLDTAGTPVDGRGPVPLRADDLRALAAGKPVTDFRHGAPLRWLAVPAILPDGSTRLVAASGDLVGGATLLGRAAAGFLFGALVVAAIIALAAWAATRAALRPVDRMRVAAAALPPGERLPMPAARDELYALASEINSLLARRDEAVARLERFTGDAAHELRSPVAAIRAQAEVAVAHPDPELADETLRSIAVEAQRLSALLSDLLALARADAGQRPPPVPVDLVAATRAAMERVADGEGPALQLVASAPAQVVASPGEVGLVLDNLLGNARRYARSVVRIGVLPAGRWVRLVVDDDGPGIPEPDRERVFDRFTRLTPEAGGGAGLGLALVAALVRGRGGSVRAGAAPDGGARLEVRWPAA
ncbi:sensor histidine kinase [Pseudonocardia asaccharolytica]|uniref:histidine kinase n=1 Tax=Pseudonocardia asaccharolytica DSM 44247 = NBRC 16224 TaxID=1123024 RepID=A0A511D4N8_9PSEU|nr:HAMP domain-containing sensor histidine kinase [Pseudonocardia asaccharolytica]GEL18554.1 two-component sensor histidine kinase [Pseudonocardia asaccharolytica DSM 44247 = NBRC 16224]